MEFVCKHSLENKEEWRAWRKTQPKNTVFGSSFPIWFSHGYKSLQQYSEEVHGRREAEDPADDPFTKRAMDHGTRCEDRAFRRFMQSRVEVEYPDLMTRSCFNVQEFTGLDSTVLRMIDDPEVVTMITPDAVLLETRYDMDAEEEYKVLQVVEIKCPIRNAPLYDSLEDWMLDFSEKHPDGYTSAFLQALLYAAVDKNVVDFYTVFYFEHAATNMEGLRAYKFTMTDELRQFALANLSEFSKALMVDEPEKKVRVPTARKKLAKEWQKNSLVLNWISHPRFITYASQKPSDEEDSKESGSN